MIDPLLNFLPGVQRIGISCGGANVRILAIQRPCLGAKFRDGKDAHDGGKQ